MDIKSTDFDKIFNSTITAASAGRDIYHILSDNPNNTDSRRNIGGGYQNCQSVNNQPISYSYGYGDKSINPYGGMMNNSHMVGTGYPGFFNPSYGNGGTW